MWCICNDHCLDIIMSIWSSINCPIVICSPTVRYFSREKPLVKPTAPGSLSHIFAFAIYFFLAFISRSIKKYKNTLVQFIHIYFIWRSIYQSTTIYSHPFIKWCFGPSHHSLMMWSRLSNDNTCLWWGNLTIFD